MTSRRTIRGLLAGVILVAAGTLAGGYVAAERSSDQVTGDPSVEQAFRSGERAPVVEQRDAITVVGTDSNAFVADENDGPRAQAELAAFAPDGSIYYYENDHTRYWDVDPVPGTAATVGFPYEAERLGTGDESAGGESATELALPSRRTDPENLSARGRVLAALPPSVANGISYLFPRWVGALEGIAVLALVAALAAWARLEYRWTDRTVELRNPLRVGRR